MEDRVLRIMALIFLGVIASAFATIIVGGLINLL